mgnify:CR=1 FL=1|tara:strand:+ start:488 stop:1195 length:708 start_codon:yes stop_codon:yes gene_type:complete
MALVGKKMIHYHGTPLTPREQLYKMAGKHFCVSFSDPRDGDVCLQIGQSIMWDNGAFTAFTKGKEVNYKGLYDWLSPRLGHPHWCVIPDVIGGSVKDNKELLLQHPFPDYLSAPVWHLNLDLDYLLFLTDRYPRVCFGSSGAYWQVGSLAWENRVNEAFNILSKKNKYIPQIHMLRGLSMCGKQYPFASADSVNVARNFKDKDLCPELMARKIDGVQCPIKWEQKLEQQTLIGVQ